MSSPAPTISVSLVTYNHEKYVAEAIHSILRQTWTDLEVIVVDDGSTDRTPEVIALFRDPRLVSIRQTNGGPSAATNRALAACRGKYVALMTGDDVAMPHRLQRQLEVYQRGKPRLLFSGCDFIDDDGRPLLQSHYAAIQFETTPRSRAQVLRRLFDGNFINAVTGFTETRLLKETGPYDPSLYQLQDCQMWINFIKKHPIEILPESLLQFRIRGKQANLSAPSRSSLRASNNERYLVMRTFFDGLDAGLFREAFLADLRRPDLTSPWAAACEQALLLLASPWPELRFLGMERMQTLYKEEPAAALLRDEFNYPLAAFIEFLKTHDPWDCYRAMDSQLYVDSGAGFHGECVAREFTPHGPQLRVTFDLSGFSTVRRVRWDPVECRMCSVRLEKVSWTDAAGGVHELDLNTVESNGSLNESGEVSFNTIDPMLILPIAGEVKSLTIEGQWKVEDEQTTLVRLHQQENLRWQLEDRRLARRCRRAARRGLDSCLRFFKSFTKAA